MRYLANLYAILGLAFAIACVVNASGEPPIEFRILMVGALVGGLWFGVGGVISVLVDIRDAISQRQESSKS